MVEIRKGNWANEQIQKSKDLKLGLVSEASEEETEIELLIRENYSLSQELALHRKKAMGVVDETEWNTYVVFVQECIDRVRNNKTGETK